MVSGVASRGPAGARPGLTAAELQVVAPWAGLHRFSILALRAPLKYLGPVSRADPAQGGVQLYYFLMNNANLNTLLFSRVT